MAPWPQTTLLPLLAGVAFALFAAHLPAAEAESVGPETAAPASGGVRVECVAPDGQAREVSRLHAAEPGAIALIMEDDTVTCVLREGETNFVVELPKKAALDRLTFLNENSRARGELKIAVSNQRLAADSPEWIPVEGIVPFANKRLFGVSLLGIEARFVRLSFHVQNHGKVAARATYETDEESETSPHEAPLPATVFASSALDQALNSSFGLRHARDKILLSDNSASVGPLTASTSR